MVLRTPRKICWQAFRVQVFHRIRNLLAKSLLTTCLSYPDGKLSAAKPVTHFCIPRQVIKLPVTKVANILLVWTCFCPLLSTYWRPKSLPTTCFCSCSSTNTLTISVSTLVPLDGAHSLSRMFVWKYKLLTCCPQEKLVDNLLWLLLFEKLLGEMARDSSFFAAPMTSNLPTTFDS